MVPKGQNGKRELGSTRAPACIDRRPRRVGDEIMKDDKRLAGLRRLRQPFWLGHGPDGTKWGAGVNL